MQADGHSFDQAWGKVCALAHTQQTVHYFGFLRVLGHQQVTQPTSSSQWLLRAAHWHHAHNLVGGGGDRPAAAKIAQEDLSACHQRPVHPSDWYAPGQQPHPRGPWLTCNRAPAFQLANVLGKPLLELLLAPQKAVTTMTHTDTQSIDGVVPALSAGVSLINSAFNNWGGGAYCEEYAVSGLPPTAVPGCLMPDATGQLINTTCYEVRLCSAPQSSSQFFSCPPHLSHSRGLTIAAALYEGELVQSVSQAPVFPLCTGNGSVEVRVSLSPGPSRVSIKCRKASLQQSEPPPSVAAALWSARIPGPGIHCLRRTGLH